MERMSITTPSMAVTATEVFTPNSQGVLALPLAMHSTFDACKASSSWLE